MTRDPVAAQFPWHVRARRQLKLIASWKRWTLLGVVIALAAVGLGLVSYGRSESALKHSAAEGKARSQQLQDALCGSPEDPGLLPTIATAPLPAQSSVLGRRIVAGARHAAEIIHCPGIP